MLQSSQFWCTLQFSAATIFISLFKDNALNLYFLWIWRRTILCNGLIQLAVPTAYRDKTSCLSHPTLPRALQINIQSMPIFSTSLLPLRLVAGMELIALLPNAATLKPHSGRKHRCFPRSRQRLPNSRHQDSRCCHRSPRRERRSHWGRHRWGATAPHRKGRARGGAP